MVKMFQANLDPQITKTSENDYTIIILMHYFNVCFLNMGYVYLHNFLQKVVEIGLSGIQYIPLCHYTLISIPNLLQSQLNSYIFSTACCAVCSSGLTFPYLCTLCEHM